MKLNLELEGKNEIEQFILIINIGLIDALKQRLISIEDAEKILYSPFVANQLEKIGVSEKIIDLIHLGWELDDVATLMPNQLDGSLNEIRDRSVDLLNLISKQKKHMKQTESSEKVRFETDGFDR